MKKAKEIRKKCESEGLDFVVEKLGAEVIEKPLGTITKEAYFKD